MSKYNKIVVLAERLFMYKEYMTSFVVDQQKYASKVKRCQITESGIKETTAFADYLSEIQHMIDATCVQLNC